MIITKTKTAPPTVPPTIAPIGRASSVSVNGIQSFIMTFKLYFICHTKLLSIAGGLDKPIALFLPIAPD